jgi:zinc and cadmium transporter
MTTLLNIIIASILVSSVSLIGGFLLLRGREISQTLLHGLVSFAAGVMLAAAFLDLLPEALEGGSAASLILFSTLTGVVFFFFIERFILWYHHHDELHDTKPSAFLVLTGDALHNFIDGIAIAAAFIANPALGVATTLAIAAHEIPQEIADLSILIYGGMKKMRALLCNFLSALTALAGAVLSYFFLSSLEGALPLFLGFTAGMFIYIACSDLIPEMHSKFQHTKAWIYTLPFLGGIGLLWIILSIVE